MATNIEMANGLALVMFGAAPGGYYADIEGWLEAGGSAEDLGEELATKTAFEGTTAADILGNLGLEEGTDAYTTALSFFEGADNLGRAAAQAVEYLLNDERRDEMFDDAAQQFRNRIDVAEAYNARESLSTDLDTLRGMVADVTEDEATRDSAIERVNEGEFDGGGEEPGDDDEEPGDDEDDEEPGDDDDDEEPGDDDDDDEEPGDDDDDDEEPGDDDDDDDEDPGVVYDGQSFTLTTEVDVIPGDGDNSGNNKIVGEVDSSSPTFSAGDNIDGGEGTDRLNLTIASGDTTNGATVDNVENIFVKSVSGDAEEVGFTSFSGVEQIWNDSSTGAVTFDNIQSLATIGVMNTDQATTATFKNSLLSGDDDTVMVELDGASADGGNITIGSEGDDGVETIAVNSGGDGANEVGTIDDGGEDDFTKLTVTGDQDLEINGVGSSLTTVDASGFGGKLTADLSGADDGNDMNVTGSAQDDTFTIDETDEDDTIDGGDGDDTVKSTGAFGATLENVESLTVEDDTGTPEVDLTNAQSIDTLMIEGSAAITGIDVTGAADGIAVTVDSDQDFTLAAGALSLKLDDDGGAGDSASLTFKGNGDVAFAANNEADGNLDIGSIEELTLTFDGGDVSVGQQTHGSAALIKGAHLETLTINGSADVDLTELKGPSGQGLSDNDDLEMVDASGMTGSLTTDPNTFDSAVTQDLTIKGGSNDDTLFGHSGKNTITGGSGNDTINGRDGDDDITGGAGNDTIAGGAGDDDLTGGAGNDAFIFMWKTEGNDTITDWMTGTNKIVFEVEEAGTAARVFENTDFVLQEDGSGNDDIGATVTTIKSDDYVEGAAVSVDGASFDENIVILTDSGGFSGVDAAFGGMGSDPGDDAAGALGFWNSTSGAFELWYVGDANGNSDATDTALLATVDDVEATGIADAFAHTSFGMIDLVEI